MGAILSLPLLSRDGIMDDLLHMEMSIVLQSNHLRRQVVVVNLRCYVIRLRRFDAVKSGNQDVVAWRQNKLHPMIKFLDDNSLVARCKGNLCLPTYFLNYVQNGESTETL